uniref:DH domain-containing protein n=1 Tax=Macrostomum lignano TaxID=282301 RepID=A0A1I8FPC7_9PLAT
NFISPSGQPADKLAEQLRQLEANGLPRRGSGPELAVELHEPRPGAVLGQGVAQGSLERIRSSHRELRNDGEKRDGKASRSSCSNGEQQADGASEPFLSFRLERTEGETEFDPPGQTGAKELLCCKVKRELADEGLLQAGAASLPYTWCFISVPACPKVYITVLYQRPACPQGVHHRCFISVPACPKSSCGLLTEVNTDRLFPPVDRAPAPGLLTARRTGQRIRPGQLASGFVRFGEIFQPCADYCLQIGNAKDYLRSLEKASLWRVRQGTGLRGDVPFSPVSRTGVIKYTRFTKKRSLPSSVLLAKEEAATCIAVGAPHELPQNYNAEDGTVDLQLKSLLTMPLQRITKYGLLLQEVLRHTEDNAERLQLETMIASPKQISGSRLTLMPYQLKYRPCSDAPVLLFTDAAAAQPSAAKRSNLPTAAGRRSRWSGCSSTAERTALTDFSRRDCLLLLVAPDQSRASDTGWSGCSPQSRRGQAQSHPAGGAAYSRHSLPPKPTRAATASASSLSPAAAPAAPGECCSTRTAAVTSTRWDTRKSAVSAPAVGCRCRARRGSRKRPTPGFAEHEPAPERIMMCTRPDPRLPPMTLHQRCAA